MDPHILFTVWYENKEAGPVRLSTCPGAVIESGSKGVEKAMAPHSSTLAWKIPWAEEPGGLLSMGSHRVGHD